MPKNKEPRSEMDYTTISLLRATKKELEDVCKKGQTWDEFFHELVQLKKAQV